VKDRPTQAHEYIFLLSKEEKYYYDFEAIKEKTNDGLNKRNKRSVWAVKTEPFKDAHFAVFPPSLIAPCIMAGSQIDSWVIDPFLGSGTVGEVCQKLGRKFVGLELNPKYAKIALKRIEKPLLQF
jgi:DNA modification methylase